MHIVYTLKRIKLTTWTICAFRVLNPRQWSLAKQSSLKSWSDAQNVPKQTKAKRDGVINPQNYNLNHLNMANFDALKTLRINRSRS